MPTAAFLPPVSHAVPAAAPRRGQRIASYTVLLALGAGLLGGCAIWPDALTIGGKHSEAVAEPVAPMPPAQPSACVAECEKRMEAAPIQPASSEPQALAPQAAQPAMAAPKPVVLAPGFYINVGLFAVAANGSNAYQKLKAAGLPAFTENLATNGNTLTRVRVGAYATRAKAQAAAKKIHSLKFDAVIFTQK